MKNHTIGRTCWSLSSAKILLHSKSGKYLISTSNLMFMSQIWDKFTAPLFWNFITPIFTWMCPRYKRSTFFSFHSITNMLLKFLKTLEWSERYFKMNNKNEVNLSENCHERDKLRCGILSKKFKRMSLTCFSPVFHFYIPLKMSENQGFLTFSGRYRNGKLG